MISKRILVFVGMTFLMGELTYAQYLHTNWGTGLYGGLQQCPYRMRAGKGAFSGSDEMDEIRKNAREAERDLNQKTRDLRKVERELKDAENKVTKVMTRESFQVVMSHVQQGAKCKDYFPQEASKTTCKEGDQGCSTASPDAQVEQLSYEPFTAGEWKKICPTDKYAENNLISSKAFCNTRTQWKEKYNPDISSCISAVPDWTSKYKQKNDLAREVKDLKEKIANYKKDYENATEAWSDELEEKMTQGDFCFNCDIKGSGYTYEKPKTDWGATILSVGLGLAGIAGNYKTNQMLAEYNSNLGYPTQQNYLGYLPGLYSVVGGVYGALTGGTSGGAFGCASGPFGNGTWNNQGMLSPFINGGLYYPGANNMWGYPGSQYANPLASLFNQGLAPWLMGPNGAIQGQIGGQMMIPGMNYMPGMTYMPGTTFIDGQMMVPGMNYMPNATFVNGQIWTPGGTPYMPGTTYMPNTFVNGQIDIGAMQMQQQMMQMQMQAQQQQAQMVLQMQQAAAQQAQVAMQRRAQQAQASMEVQMQIQQLTMKLQQLQMGGGYDIYGSAGLGLSGGLNVNGNFGLSTGLGVNSSLGNSGLNFGVGNQFTNPVINPGLGNGNRQSR